MCVAPAEAGAYVALERFSSRLNRKGIPIGRDF
jgi:hypothetical protein